MAPLLPPISYRRYRDAQRCSQQRPQTPSYRGQDRGRRVRDGHPGACVSLRVIDSLAHPPPSPVV
jgi:hypothetical protein